MRKHRWESALYIAAPLLLVTCWLVIRDGAGWVSDALLAEYPLRAVYAEGLARGELTLWSPNVLGGYPLLAGGDFGALYPPNLTLHLLMSVPVALTLFLVGHLFWAGLGTYSFVRRRSLSWGAATGASLLFVLSMQVTSPLSRPGLVACLSWLPWLLLLADRVLKPGSSHASRRDVGLFALSLGMAFLTGVASAAMMALTAVGAFAVYTLVTRQTRAKFVLQLALGTATGILLASAQLVPSLELGWMSTPAPPIGVSALVWRLPRATALLLPDHWPALVVFATALMAGVTLDQILKRPGGRIITIILSLSLVGLIAIDLGVYSARWATGASLSDAIARLQQTTESASFLRARTGVHRILAESRESASDDIIGESLLSNLPLLHGLSSASGLTPRIPNHFALYLREMTPQKLNLLGVKYVLVPLVSSPGASPGQGFQNSFMYNPLDDVMPTPLVMASAIEIEWYLSDSADWENQAPVAMLTLMAEEAVDIMDYILSAGSHTADWALERSDIRGRVKHDKAIVARTFPARSSSPPQWFSGQVYRTNIKLPYAVLIHGIRIESLADPERVHMERVTLIDQDGNRYLFSQLAGFSNHTLAFRSDDVAIFENHAVLPRVFLAYEVHEAADEDEASMILRSPKFDPLRHVVLPAEKTSPVSGPTAGIERVELELYSSSRVVVQVEAPVDGYLVLTDTWYPGWRAFVDGEETRVLRADLAFRSVFVPAGQHRITFDYRPTSFRAGLVMSVLALALSLWLFLGTVSSPGTARRTPQKTPTTPRCP